MRIRIAIAILLFATVARANFREFKDVPVDPAMETKIRVAAELTLKQYPKLTPDNFAISVIDLTKPSTIARADYHGAAAFYPASVVKLFFMVETYHQGKENVPDVPRALKEMIVVSDNDAAGYILAVISNTCGGPELQGRALDKFIYARGVANRYFDSMGYNVSAMAKPWEFGPFGREVQVVGPKRERRNRATANDVAALMLWIARRRAVSPAASDAMMALMERPLNPQRKDENQVKEFIGEALPAGSKLWSKAGWTSEVRHDAAYVELPDGRKMVVVIFTRGTADDVTLVPAATKNLLAEFGAAPPPPPPPPPPAPMPPPP
jgi:Beta-lactamase enzyme family